MIMVKMVLGLGLITRKLSLVEFLNVDFRRISLLCFSVFDEQYGENGFWVLIRFGTELQENRLWV